MAGGNVFFLGVCEWVCSLQPLENKAGEGGTALMGKNGTAGGEKGPR